MPGWQEIKYRDEEAKTKVLWHQLAGTKDLSSLAECIEKREHGMNIEKCVEIEAANNKTLSRWRGRPADMTMCDWLPDDPDRWADLGRGPHTDLVLLALTACPERDAVMRHAMRNHANGVAHRDETQCVCRSMGRLRSGRWLRSDIKGPVGARYTTLVADSEYTSLRVFLKTVVCSFCQCVVNSTGVVV